MADALDKPAHTSVPVHDLIARRWSPRAFDRDGAVTDEQVRALLEAARWAPSYGNTQPARYLVGRRGDAVHTRILAALNDGNRTWAERAPVLMVGVALTRNAKGDIPMAEYGLALATQNLVLQAVAEGLAAHQMAGFDRDAVRRAFALPSDARPVVAIAVGRQGAPELLEDPAKVERERAERRRVPLEEFAFGDWDVPAF